MIFDWKKEFDEKTLCDGLDLEDDVKDLDVGYDLIYGWVDDHYITIGLADDFKVESMECECGKKRCSHMAAVLYASESFKKDVEYDLFVDNLDDSKLISFLKEELSYNEILLDEFKDKFRNDIISKSQMYPELKLYIILDDIFWQENLPGFIEDDLMKSYETDKREAIYLIASMFDKVIDAYSFDEENQLGKSWKTLEKLIIKLYDDVPEIVYMFLKKCADRNYDTYPAFKKLYEFYLKIRKNHE